MEALVEKVREIIENLSKSQPKIEKVSEECFAGWKKLFPEREYESYLGAGGYVLKARDWEDNRISKHHSGIIFDIKEHDRLYLGIPEIEMFNIIISALENRHEPLIFNSMIMRESYFSGGRSETKQDNEEYIAQVSISIDISKAGNPQINYEILENTIKCKE